MTTTTLRPNSLADLLRQAGTDRERRREWRRQGRDLLLPVALTLLLLAAWSAGAPLSGAVVAQAQLKVEYKRKTVQHQEGGIVREVLVHTASRYVQATLCW